MPGEEAAVAGPAGALCGEGSACHGLLLAELLLSGERSTIGVCRSARMELLTFSLTLPLLGTGSFLGVSTSETLIGDVAHYLPSPEEGSSNTNRGLATLIR